MKNIINSLISKLSTPYCPKRKAEALLQQLFYDHGDALSVEQVVYTFDELSHLLDAELREKLAAASKDSQVIKKHLSKI